MQFKSRGLTQLVPFVMLPPVSLIEQQEGEAIVVCLQLLGQHAEQIWELEAKWVFLPTSKSKFQACQTFTGRVRGSLEFHTKRLVAMHDVGYSCVVEILL
jgi:hypothetical protein